VSSEVILFIRDRFFKLFNAFYFFITFRRIFTFYFLLKSIRIILIELCNENE